MEILWKKWDAPKDEFAFQHIKQEYRLAIDRYPRQTKQQGQK